MATRHGGAPRAGTAATERNDIWSMDFVADELTGGRKFRTLTVLDLFTRQCLDIAVGRGLTGQDVVATSSDSDSIAVCRNASIATTAPSSSARRWTCGRTATASCSTSAAEGSRRTTPRSSPTMNASVTSA